ncbi:hypothetical protein BKA65DRAFT_101347 [Rhexocercosporidium sp. MPI-PUGE-AT-0058]|nr:hypothetical protein BKA65DRAFT_101347 [Rhexocercosporidium sp. MPI-PUGE-AT-0058]
MDAHALLTSQGWRGTGNSLHPTSNTIGLSRPLLVSKKVDNLGIGKKQHRTSDMWWMNAFDSSLKGLDTSKEGQVIQTITSGGLDMVQKAGAKWVGSKGGLYASFVRGEGLGGTISPEEVESVSSESRKEGGEDTAGNGNRERKRKRGEGKESKEERRERKAAKKVMKAERVELVMRESKPIETKEERKARRAAKRASKGQDSKALEVEVGSVPIEIKETKEERKSRKTAERELRDQQSKLVEESHKDVEMKDVSRPETKEERKARRRLKKLAKEAEAKEESAADSSEKAKKKKRRKD